MWWGIIYITSSYLCCMNRIIYIFAVCFLLGSCIHKNGVHLISDSDTSFCDVDSSSWKTERLYYCYWSIHVGHDSIYLYPYSFSYTGDLDSAKCEAVVDAIFNSECHYRRFLQDTSFYEENGIRVFVRYSK